MSDSLDAMARRLEAVRAAYERIKAAHIARDAAEHAMERTKAELHASLRGRHADYPGAFNVLDDTEHNRKVMAWQYRNVGQTVIFTSDPDYRSLALADQTYRFAQTAYEAALRARLPQGWEGDAQGTPDFISLVDVEPWLTAMLDLNLALRDSPISSPGVVKLTAHNINNFYRVLDHLGINDRPPNYPTPIMPANANEAETVVRELRRWVRQQLDGPQSLAELRFRLRAAGDYASQISEPPSMDGVEEAGDNAAHVFESRICQCERRACHRLSAFLRNEFMPLADRIIERLGHDKFPRDRDPPLELPNGIPAYDLAAGLFGLEYSDLSSAGKLLLVWSAWAQRDGKYRPLGWRDRYLTWANVLVSRRSGEPTTPCVLGQPFNWALAAFDELAAAMMPQREPLLTPEVRAWIEPLRAQREMERASARRQAEIFLLAQGWRPDVISSYLTFPSNVQKALDAEQFKRSTAMPPANDAPDQAPPATGGKEQGEGADQQFIFSLDGDGYFIKGLGESGHVKGKVGFHHIAKLIAQPGTPILMTELLGAGDAATDRHSRQPAMDAQGKQQVRERLQELQEEIDDAKERGDVAAQERATEEKERYTEQLKAATGVLGKDRDINSEVDKNRPRILGAVKRACDALRKSTPPMIELAHHFQAGISADGPTVVYRAATAIVWCDRQ